MDKQLLLFGLMRKAGRIAIGDEPVTDAIRRGEVLCVCVASDAAENTVDRFRRFAQEEEIPFLQTGFDKRTFGGIFGRKDVAVAGVTDLGFAAKLLEMDEAASQTPLAREYRARADQLVEEQKKKRRKPASRSAEPPASAAEPAQKPDKSPPRPKKPGETGENPFENREGKIYGRAPKAERKTIGDRRREDAARKAARGEEAGPDHRWTQRGGTASGHSTPYGGKRGYDDARKTDSRGEKRSAQTRAAYNKKNAPESHKYGKRAPEAGRPHSRPSHPSVKRGNGGKA